MSARILRLAFGRWAVRVSPGCRGLGLQDNGRADRNTGDRRVLFEPIVVAVNLPRLHAQGCGEMDRVVRIEARSVLG